MALVSQSGNVAVNALATRRGLRLHTVVSCGNSVALDPADWVAALAAEERVGSIALYLEDDCDGARLCEALARCAERGVGVAVLKVGTSAAGAVAAAAHTGAVAGDQRVFRALVEEAGAAWAEDVHELLELAKVLAVPGSHPLGDGGLAVLTCSGGDSALAADECERIGLRLPPLEPATAERLRELLPDAATVGNPLDYTALIWGEVETLRDIIAATGADPGIDQLLVLYDQPAGIDGAPDASWAAVREGILAGAAASRVPVSVALHAARAARRRGGRALRGRRGPAGRRAAHRARLRGRAAQAAGRRAPAARDRRHGAVRSPTGAADGWLAEHEAKQLLRAARLPVVDGRLVAGEDDAAAALAELGGPVAVKLSAPTLRHKTEAGALVLGRAR